MRGFREIAERLAGPGARARVKVFLAGGAVEGVLEFVDGPLWVVADRGARTWIDEQSVQAVTVVDARQVSDAIAESPSNEIPGPATLQARVVELAERFDCKVSGDPPASDEGRAAMGRVLLDLDAALRRVVAQRGDAFLDDGLRIEIGEPGVRRVDEVLVVGYRPGPNGRLDPLRIAAGIEAVSGSPMGDPPKV